MSFRLLAEITRSRETNDIALRDACGDADQRHFVPARFALYDRYQFRSSDRA